VLSLTIYKMYLDQITLTEANLEPQEPIELRPCKLKNVIKEKLKPGKKCLLNSQSVLFCPSACCSTQSPSLDTFLKNEKCLP